MAKRENHYEAAFEAYLRTQRTPYVAVDETRRSLAEQASLKSLDFIVSSSQGCSWLVDVKGRRFPSGEKKRYWKNWSTRDDLISLTRWQELFGDQFRPLFVFAYNVQGRRAPLPVEQLFCYQDQLYGFIAIRLEQYIPHARLISAKWDTVAMSTRRFRELAQPFADFL